MRKRIKLRTHDGSKNYLVFREYSEPFYIFSLEAELDSLGVTRDDENNILMVDPSGGPLIALGDNKIIPGMILRKITMNKSVKLYFKSISHAPRSS